MLMKCSLPQYKRLHLATLIAIAAPYVVFADKAQNTSNADEKITITAARSLPNAEGVDNEVLKSLVTATSDTASLLKNVSGVNIQASGGVSGFPVIHGMADDRLRIKVDGMDLISACANHMNPPLSYIDPTNVGSATVFAGITPVSIGGDSIGSTIMVDSPSPEFSDDDKLLTNGAAGISYRSNNGAVSGNIAATVANKNYSMSYRGSSTEADNYNAGNNFKAAGLAASGRGWLDGDEVGSSMYKSTNHSLAFAMQQENHLLELTFGIQDIPYQGWVNQRMDMTGNDSDQINLHYTGEFDWGMLEGRAYSEETRHSMQFFDDKLFWYGPNMMAPAADGMECTPSAGMNGCAAGMPMDTEGDNKGFVLKANINLNPTDVLRVGTEIQKYSLDDWWEPSGKGMWPNTFWNINQGERDRLAIFTEWESKLNSQWLMQFGARYEQVDMNAGEVQGYMPTMMAQYGPEAAAFNAADREKSDNNVDLTALARYQPDNNHSVEFGYARKSRSPNLYERYSWSTGGMVMRMVNMAGDGNGYVGNLDLEPEVAHTVSATFNWADTASQKWNIAATPYYTYVDDYIDAQRCVSANTKNCGSMNQMATDAYVYLQFVNQSASMYGFDLAGDYTLVENSEYGNFKVTAMLNYVHGENQTTDDTLYNMMPLNIKLAMQHNRNNWFNTIEVELVDSKTDTSAVRNELETSGFALLHFRGNYQWDSARLDFGIENVFDKFYNHPLSGAYTGQGKTMSGTGIPWGVSVPGMGRSIYVGVNFTF